MKKTTITLDSFELSQIDLALITTAAKMREMGLNDRACTFDVILKKLKRAFLKQHNRTYVDDIRSK